MAAVRRRGALWALALLLPGSAGADGAGFVLETVGPPFATTEGGGRVTLELKLSAEAREDVTFRLRSTDPREATAEPATVTVTAGGEVPAAVRIVVTGVQDDVDDDDVAYEIEAEPVSGDPAFVALGSRRVRLVNLDDDVAGIRVSPPVILIRPGGPAVPLQARLTSRPREGGVEAAVTSGRPDAARASPDGLSFPGGAGWSEPLPAQVVPAASAGPSSPEIAVGPVWSADPLYAGVVPDAVTVVRTGSRHGVTVAPMHGLATTEDGGSAAFFVALNTRPAQAVTLSLASSEPGEATVSPAALVFTPENWQAVREVTVTGRNDGRDDGPVPYRVLVTPQAGGASTTVELVNLPSTAAPAHKGEVVLLAPSGGLTARQERAAALGVVLSRPPASEVWVYLHSDRPEMGTVEPSAVGFTPADWSTPRTVSVRALDVPAGGGSLQVVTDLTWSQDAGFRGLDPRDVRVVLPDPRRDGGFFTITPCRLNVSRQGGGEPLRSGVATVLTVRGRCGVPAEAQAVAVNLTAITPSGNGSLAAYPPDVDPTGTSTVSFRTGTNSATNAILPLSADGRLALLPSVAGNGTLHLVVDVVGYFE